MLNKIFATDSNNYSLLVARIAIGAVILPHGLQKLLGMFGGYGFTASVGFFESIGIPAVVAFLIIMAESVGALALIVGFMSRFCAFSLGIVMMGAMFMAHWQNGFFMNWFGNQEGEGYEYHLLAIGLCLTVLIGGGGKFSLDSKIGNK